MCNSSIERLSFNATDHTVTLTICMLAELGTRPGLSGQTLVSTGLADFDKLLGGGVPLGTVVLLLEDNHTQNHSTLIKYFLAEGAANKQALYWSAGHARHASASRALPQQVQHTPKVPLTLSSNSHCLATFWDMLYHISCRMSATIARLLQ